LTIAIYSILFSFVVGQGLIMVNREHPYIQSVLVPVDKQNNGNKYFLRDLNTIFFSVIDSSFSRSTIKDLEPYIEIRLKMYFRYVDTQGKSKKLDPKYYPFKDCV